MTRREMDARGWTECDAVIVTGDAYVDHPSFGAALIGRFLESLGYRVGIIAQPDPRNVEDFRALGRPRLFWGVTAGNVDSQLAQLTIMRKLRRDDPYSPDGKGGRRPPNASIVYTAMARQAFKGVPVVLGGIEASLRRFAYYDFWTDRVRRSILFDAKADILAFGMAERAIEQIAARLKAGHDLRGIPGTAEICRDVEGLNEALELPTYDEVAAPTEPGRLAFARTARLIHLNHSVAGARVLLQKHGERWLVAHPPAAPLQGAELDRLYALPFTRRPHPAYGKARIPAFEMIRDSVTTHRGCYADCTFCAIAAHQGVAVSSRGERGILAEIEHMAGDPDFHGTVSDLGGPTANMYGTGCRAGRPGCSGRNCLDPALCRNLNPDHGPLLHLMRAARQVKGVKHVFVTSGLRFDLALAGGGKPYIEELVRHHVCGLLKIAPEHVSDRVLRMMRKPSASQYRQFVDLFMEATRAAGRKHGIVEYFMSGHPGCTLEDMVELAQYLHAARVQPEQVQDFYPAPMTLAAAMFYTGLDPLTMARVYVARGDRDKALQRALLLHHKPEFQGKAREALMAAGREDLIGRGKHCLVPPDPAPRARQGRARSG